MKNIIILFGSTTGSTEEVAGLISKSLEKESFNVRMENVSDVSVEIFNDPSDAIILGCSTWGEDSIELQDDFVEFYDDMESVSLDNRKIAVFGCGDSDYTYFCGAVDVIEERAGQRGATILTESLKIDGDPEDSLDEITAWAKTLIETI